ncbi:MAG: glutamate racemase [Acidobacteria bacterium]|nr:glutamate racemase [Acidobacteriota bacterium]
MIGFFDSGLGGLTVLKEVEKLLPQYSYLYLGDNARTPYGSRSQETIYEFTTDCVRELFSRRAELIILACNTASSSALRSIQQRFLPEHYPDKRVLGILIPVAEEAPRLTRTKHIGVLATEATVASRAYIIEIAKADPDIKVFQQACPLLVPIIELEGLEWEGLDLILEKYVRQLLAQSREIDAVILGCTHYAILKDRVERLVGPDIQVVSQSSIVAAKLKNYLERHPEIERRLEKKRERIFLTTESSERTKHLARLFFNSPIEMDSVSLHSE